MAASPSSDHSDSDHNSKDHSGHHEESGEETAADRSEFIQHHLQDAHSFVIWDAMHWVIPMPVILIDEGLHLFSSSKFGHHEHDTAESNGKFFTKHEGIVYRSDSEGALIETDGSHIKPLDLSLTKNVMMIIITSILMFLLFRGLGRSYAKNGGIAKGVGRFMEPIVLYIRDEIAIPNIGEKKYMKYMPYLLTVFFFVWFLNLFGLTPLGVNVTGNIAVTAALALITFLLTNFTGTKDYWKHIFDPLGDAMPWIAKIWLYLILWPIEILGVFIKPFSLLIRLYANMLAGHTVLMSLIALIYVSNLFVGDVLAFGLSFAISLIELLVALLQAYIFTMLSALYFGFAAEEHEHHHEEAHAH
ncbi:MAG: F0F1 ATP synthase subunit A [Flavobacteriales bacterium]